MANSFTLAKGKILRMTYKPTVDGEPLVVGNDWNVSSYMQRQGSCDTIDLEPTISGGFIEVEYDTVDLDPGTYNIDFRFTETGNDDEFSGLFFMHLVKTITPPSTR